MKEKKKRNKFFSALVYIISALIFILALFLLLTSMVFQSNDKAYLMGYRPYVVLTGSMEPDIKTGSLVIIKQTDPDTIKVGDVISFISEDPKILGQIVSHNVVEIKEDEKGERVFITQGSANQRVDEYPVNEVNVTGVVVYHSHALGNIYNALSNRAVLFALTIVPLAVIVIYTFIEVVKNARLLKDSPKESETDTEDKEKVKKENPEQTEDNPEGKNE